MFLLCHEKEIEKGPGNMRKFSKLKKQTNCYKKVVIQSY